MKIYILPSIYVELRIGNWRWWRRVLLVWRDRALIIKRGVNATAAINTHDEQWKQLLMRMEEENRRLIKENAAHFQYNMALIKERIELRQELAHFHNQMTGATDTLVRNICSTCDQPLECIKHGLCHYTESPL